MNIGIVGFGVEGKSTLDYLLQSHAPHTVVVYDRCAPTSPLPEGVRGVFGEDYLDHIHECAVLYRTPGLSPATSQLLHAAARGSTITSHINEFFAQAPCPIIGVTGTKGKGTTSVLLYEVLKANGYDVHLGGNVGTPPLGFLSQLTPASWVVLELSSFQLMDCVHSPHIAVVLAITSDHLDYHTSVMEYREAKSSIVTHQSGEDICVYNGDYTPLQSIVERSAAAKVPFSTKELLAEGISVVDGVVSLGEGGHHRHVLFMKELALVGGFHAENIAPVLTVAWQLGILNATTLEVVRQYHNLPHRLQYVDKVQGVAFYDDSYATVPDTALRSLASFPGQRKVVIVGGSHKGGSYTELLTAVLGDLTVCGVLWLGTEAAPMMATELQALNTAKPVEQQRFVVTEAAPLPAEAQLPLLYSINVPEKEHLYSAVQQLLPMTDIVLLAPGCASFDLFANATARGVFFQDMVRELQDSLSQ